MNSLILIVALWVGPSEKYTTGQDFIKAEHLKSVSSLCKKYHAKHCVLTKEYAHDIDDVGFSPENRTATWVLYGAKE
jgi:hypothetical protein